MAKGQCVCVCVRGCFRVSMQKKIYDRIWHAINQNLSFSFRYARCQWPIPSERFGLLYIRWYARRGVSGDSIRPAWLRLFAFVGRCWMRCVVPGLFGCPQASLMGADVLNTHESNSSITQGIGYALSIPFIYNTRTFINVSIKRSHMRSSQ